MRRLAALLVAFACSIASAQPLILVKDGQSEYKIVVGQAASKSELRGASELQSFIKKMTDVELPIINNANNPPAKAIVIESSTEFGDEGFQLVTTGPRLHIKGGSLRGAMYGCSEVLEKLGVRFYTDRFTHIPITKQLILPILNETHRPAFEYRESYCTEAWDKDWAARLRLNGNFHKLDDSTGGKVRYSHFVHTFDALIPREMHNSFPELFPLINGKRETGYVQRCLTHPNAVNLATSAVLKWIQADPQATIFSVSQNDTYKFCECDECKKIEAQFGGVHSGVYLWFVNKVAENIEKQHPGKLIDTLAYQFTEAPPRGIAPRKNVRVRLCPIAACNAHPLDKCTEKHSVAFMQNLAGWARITDTLYIWHYNTNFANYLLPFPNFEEFPHAIRLYKKSGVKGIFEQAAYGPGGGGSFAELQAYVMGHMLWNPDVDEQALIKEWHEGVFGKAAGPMIGWHKLLHAKVRPADKHFHIFDGPTVHYMSADTIQAGERFFELAEKSADNETARYYIAKAKLGLRYAKIAQTNKTGPELDAFLADVRNFKIGQLREGQGVDEWEKRFRAKAAAASPK